MAQVNLQTAMQTLTAQEKQNLLETFLRYDNAKKTGENTQEAYIQVRDLLKDLERKCGTTIFVSLVPEQMMVDKITEKVLLKMGYQPTQQPAKPQTTAKPAVQTAVQPVAQPVVRPAAQPVAQPPQQRPIPHYTCVFRDLQSANQWLAQQRNVAITNLQVDTSRVGLDITGIRIEYHFLPQPYQYPYQLTELRKNRFFAKSKPQKVHAQWEKNNPTLRCLSSIKRTWGFSLFGGSVGYFRYIKEKYIILFTAKVA